VKDPAEHHRENTIAKTNPDKFGGEGKEKWEARALGGVTVAKKLSKKK